MDSLKQAMRQNGPFVVVAGLLCILAAMQPVFERIGESRLWRDLTGQTPFRDVRITSVSATELEITLSGTFVKARDCRTVGSAVAQVIVEGVAYPADFRVGETAATPPSRPVGSHPQVFGPWIITSPISWPDEARMYRTHNCGGRIQTNEVFAIAWPKEGEE